MSKSYDIRSKRVAQVFGPLNVDNRAISWPQLIRVFWGMVRHMAKELLIVKSSIPVKNDMYFARANSFVI
jgi:hypothetical protein